MNMNLASIVTATNEWRIVASNFCGSLSLACWIIIIYPQLLEQWRTKSAEAIAIVFLIAWALGDVFNLIGCIFGGLRPNITLLAVWYCVSDSLLLASYFYYKHKKRQAHLARIQRLSHHEGESLLSQQEEIDDDDEEEEVEPVHCIYSTAIPLALVLIIGGGGYMISDNTVEKPKVEIGLVAEVAGYLSAAFYVFARIPQIIQNHRRRSVQGLSIGFFQLSVLGNLTYAAQILIYRHDQEWISEYMPWLIGSLGTVAEDCIIFAQFYVYRRHN